MRNTDRPALDASQIMATRFTQTPFELGWWRPFHLSAYVHSLFSLCTFLPPSLRLSLCISIPLSVFRSSFVVLLSRLLYVMVFRKRSSAASDLFADRGVDDVTTQEIAAAADIGAGTLFFYARTKGEPLLMVQNALYAEALEDGRRSAAAADDPVAAVLAVVTPIIHCNRAQVENGRTYLREIVFGDPAEPHHAKALEIVAETEQLLAVLPGYVG
jgi:hypothetical protein